MTMYKYNQEFYDYIEKGSIRSSQVLVPLIAKLIQPASVLDVGCGRGAWLKAWKEHAKSVLGIDGEYVDQENLLIERGEFKPQDLSQPFQLNNQYDLVQCLEVAEHLPESKAETLVQSLCKHSDIILFSAATPGQGGENHINEQPFSYWREKFLSEGFTMLDPFRPLLVQQQQVEAWYKYNTFLYVRTSRLEEDLSNLREFRVPAHSDARDYAPLLYQIRKRIIRLLPTFMSTSIARIKKHAVIVKLRLEK